MLADPLGLGGKQKVLVKSTRQVLWIQQRNFCPGREA